MGLRRLPHPAIARPDPDSGQPDRREREVRRPLRRAAQRRRKDRSESRGPGDPTGDTGLDRNHSGRRRRDQGGRALCDRTRRSGLPAPAPRRGGGARPRRASRAGPLDPATREHRPHRLPTGAQTAHTVAALDLLAARGIHDRHLPAAVLSHSRKRPCSRRSARTTIRRAVPARTTSSSAHDSRCDVIAPSPSARRSTAFRPRLRRPGRSRAQRPLGPSARGRDPLRWVQVPSTSAGQSTSDSHNVDMQSIAWKGGNTR